MNGDSLIRRTSSTTLLEIGERQELDARRVGPRLLGESFLELLGGERQHPAVGVMDDHELSCAQELGGDDERANRIIGGSPSRVSDDVGVSDVQPQEPLRVKPSRPCR
jgi:hypothetical protein